MEKAGYGLYYAPSGDPMENYRYLFVENWNKEIIFAKNVAIYDQMERAAAPLSLGGWSGLCPTQELVDAYEMADGTTPILGYNADGSPINLILNQDILKKGLRKRQMQRGIIRKILLICL